MTDLRKLIFSFARVKHFNGEEVSGELLVQLAEQYVGAMNEKALPNILNSWEYICNQQCEKAVIEGQQLFQDMVKESLEGNWPVSEENLVLIFKECKDTVLRQFDEQCLGERKSFFF